MKHHTEDYKLSAVKYYLKNDISMEKLVKYLNVIINHYIVGLKDIMLMEI